MTELLNQNQLAKRLNLTKGRISQLKSEGRLNSAQVTDPITKRVLFSLEKVLVALSISENSIKQNENEALLEDLDDEDQEEHDDDNLDERAAYDRSRAKKMRYTAELERLEYEKLKGNLISNEQVEKEAFECARRVREALTNMPDRLSSELAATSSEIEVHKILTNEINQVLEELSKQ